MYYSSVFKMMTIKQKPTEKINIQLPELLSKNKPYKTVSARAMEDTKVIKLPFGAFKVKSQLYEW